VIAESYERIHRSNLVGMGIIPLQFLEGESAASLKLTGREKYSIDIPKDVKPHQTITVQVHIFIHIFHIDTLIGKRLNSKKWVFHIKLFRKKRGSTGKSLKRIYIKVVGSGVSACKKIG